MRDGAIETTALKDALLLHVPVAKEKSAIERLKLSIPIMSRPALASCKGEMRDRAIETVYTLLFRRGKLCCKGEMRDRAIETKPSRSSDATLDLRLQRGNARWSD